MRLRLAAVVGAATMVLTGVITGACWAQGPEVSGGRAVPLWPNGAPGAKGSADVDKPSLTIFLPASNPTKTGVVIAPGGGYVHLAMDKEGFAVARWLNERGVAAFVLKYRLGPEYHYPVELEDAQRAIRMVRAGAGQFGVAPDHVGMMGFSAGGHLTATAGTHFDSGKAGAVDAIDRQGSRPDFLLLGYPVITFLEPYAHTGSRKYLLGDSPEPKLLRSLSDETQVTKETPATFLFTTTDDNVVPVMNSVMFYTALVKAGVPAEMHIFQHGAHGAGLAANNPELSVWPDLMIQWMRQRGFAGPEGKTAAR